MIYLFDIGDMAIHPWGALGIVTRRFSSTTLTPRGKCPGYAIVWIADTGQTKHRWTYVKDVVHYLNNYDRSVFLESDLSPVP